MKIQGNHFCKINEYFRKIFRNPVINNTILFAMNEEPFHSKLSINLMKKNIFILSILVLLLGVGVWEVQAQNVTILPSGISPSPAGAVPRISYEAIMALPSPQGGDLAYDITFSVMRMYNGTDWLILRATDTSRGEAGIYETINSKQLENYSVAIDIAGNVYISGRFKGTFSAGGFTLVSAGGYDLFVAKFNSSGTMQWLRRGGGQFDDFDHRLAIDASGNVYVTGGFQSVADFNTPSASGKNELVSAGGLDIFIAKYNSAGALQWLRRGGGAVNDRGNDIAIDGNNNIYIIGSFTGTANFNTPSAFGSNQLISAGTADFDMCVAKYNSAGTLQWIRRGGGTANDVGLGIAVDPTGVVYVTGSFAFTANFNTPSASGSNELVSVSNGVSDLFLVKYSTLGTLQWIRRGGGSSFDYGTDVALDATGNVYVTGKFSATANFNTPSAAGSNELVSAGLEDILVVKYSSSGVVQLLRRGGGAGNDIGHGIVVDESGNIYVTGEFKQTANFNTPTATGSNEMIAAGTDLASTDMFTAKYNAAGTVQWLQRGGGPSYDHGYGIALGANDNVYVVGTYRGLAPLGLGTFNTGSNDVLGGFWAFFKQ